MYIPFIYEKNKHGFWSETKFMKEIETFPEQFSEIESFYGNTIFANVNYVDEQNNNIFIENNSLISLSKEKTRERLEKEINFFTSLVFNSGSVDLLQSNINEISAYEKILEKIRKNNILNIDLKADFKKKVYINCINNINLLLNFNDNGFEKHFCFEMKRIIMAVTTLLIFDNKLDVSIKNSPCCTYLDEKEKVKLDISQALSILS